MNPAHNPEATPTAKLSTRPSSRAAVARKTLQNSVEAQAVFGLGALFVVASLAFGVLAVILC